MPVDRQHPTGPSEPSAPYEPPVPGRSEPTVNRRGLSLAVFLVLAFGLAWLVASPLWLLDTDGLPAEAAALLATGVGAAMMLTPGLAAFVAARWVERHRGRALVARLRLGGWGGFRRIALWTLGFAAAIIVLCLITAAVAIGFGAITPDWTFSALEAQAEGVMPGWVLFALTAASIPIAAIIPNALLATGEEIGWRGYLTPVLAPLGRPATIALSGVIWGLWHAPLVMLGHNFGLYGLPGVGLIIVGCVVVGALFIAVTERTSSVWPAVVGHGAFNAAAGIGLAVQSAAVPPDLVIANPLGVAGWIVFGAAGLGWFLLSRLGSSHGRTPRTERP